MIIVFVFYIFSSTSYTFNITMTSAEVEWQKIQWILKHQSWNWNMIVLPRNMLEQIITDDYKDVVNHMFTKLHADLGQPKTEENILQLKLLQNALTEHLVFANRLHGLKVDINVV